jgi:hypothetical protein
MEIFTTSFNLPLPCSPPLTTIARVEDGGDDASEYKPMMHPIGCSCFTATSRLQVLARINLFADREVDKAASIHVPAQHCLRPSSASA